MLARQGQDGDGKVVFIVGVIQATTVPFAGLVARQRRAVVAEEACGVTRRATLVVSVVCYRTLHCRLLLIGRVLQAFSPLMLCRATRIAVHFARGALALAVFLAASRRLPLSRLIVMRGIPITSQAFATVALLRSIGGAAVVATAIVLNTTTMAPISLVDNVAASIAAKSNLASGALVAPAVGGLTDPSTEFLQSFAKETLVDTIRLLAFDCTVELFLLKESLKKGCDGLDGLVVERFFCLRRTSRGRSCGTTYSTIGPQARPRVLGCLSSEGGWQCGASL